MINGTKYRILNRWNTQSNTWIPIEGRYWRDGSDSEVYFLSYNPFNGYEEKLRYAFNVSKGDTLIVSDQEVVVDWISIVKQYEDTVRVVYIHNLIDSTQTNIWMQGGGAVFSPFTDEFDFYNNSFGENLECYWRNDTLRMSYSNDDCEEGLVSILSNTTSLSLDLWPNPATTFVTVTLPENWNQFKQARYQLIQSDGRIIDEQKVQLTEDKLTFYIPSGISGVHIVRLLSDEGHMANGIILIN